MRVVRIIILAMIFISVPFLTYARDWREIKFTPVFENDGYQLNLKGIGLKKAFFMKAFVAGFYLDDDASVNNVLSDVPKRIEVYYFVHIPKDKLSNYTEKLMKDNTTQEIFASLKDEMILMRKYFVDLKPGDRYALTYIPQMGTKFEHNGQLMGIINGEDFAKGLFSTWLGEQPMDQKIKKQILGVANSINEDLELTMLSESL